MNGDETKPDPPTPATPDRRDGRPMEPPNATAADRSPDRLCAAHRTNGETCGNYRMHGQRVCRKHGGGALQSRAAAQRRLMEAADPAVAALVKIVRDEKRDDDRRLRAISDLLNRVPGLSSREGVDVNVFDAGASDDEKLTPFEKLVKGLSFGGIDRDAATADRADPSVGESGALDYGSPPRRGPRPNESDALQGEADPNIVEAELIEEPVAPSPVTPPRRPATPTPDPFFGYADAELYRDRAGEFGPDRPTAPRAPRRRPGPGRRPPR